MPADMSTGLTLEQLMLRVADDAGLLEYSGTTEALPDDPLILAKLKRAVNDGLRQLRRDNPRWSWLDLLVELQLRPDGDGPLNLAGRPELYRLPRGVTACRPKGGRWWYTDSSASGTTIEDTAEQVVRRRFAIQDTSGDPFMAACFAHENEGPSRDNPQRVWAVIFYPKPATAHTVGAIFRTLARELVDLHERHEAGAEFDDAVVAYALWKWWQGDATDGGKLALRKQEAAEALASAMRLDLENKPRTLPQIRDPSFDMEEGHPRRLGDMRVTTVSGIDVLNSGLT